MRTGPPVPVNPQAGNGYPGTTAACWPADRSLDARRARLTALWALVLRRFREYASRGRHPDAGPEHPAEEDR
jgi:hypothetical protein